MRQKLLLILILGWLIPLKSWAAVGCTLSNPAEDLKYLYPEMTTFKEDLWNFETHPEGRKLYQELTERVGNALDPIYETFETPYTVYLVFRSETLIGVVHGVNVPGRGGVIQVFLATDPKSGEVQNFFFQRLESPDAKALRKREFRDQFRGLSLADWYKHDYYKNSATPTATDRVAQIQKPTLSPEGEFDFEASLRGVRKNLILLDMFFYGRRFEPFFKKAKEALEKKLLKEQAP